KSNEVFQQYRTMFSPGMGTVPPSDGPALPPDDTFTRDPFPGPLSGIGHHQPPPRPADLPIGPTGGTRGPGDGKRPSAQVGPQRPGLLPIRCDPSDGPDQQPRN